MREQNSNYMTGATKEKEKETEKKTSQSLA